MIQPVIQWLSVCGSQRFFEGREREPRLAAMLKVLEQVAMALKYLHNVGIVHGDLKCENVLVDKYVSIDEVNIKVQYPSRNIIRVGRRVWL